MIQTDSPLSHSDDMFIISLPTLHQQDDTPEDWYYDFEDFSAPPNFSSKTDLDTDDWKDEVRLKPRWLAREFVVVID